MKKGKKAKRKPVKKGRRKNLAAEGLNARFFLKKAIGGDG